MLIRPVSDLHLEFKSPWTPPELPTDPETVLVLAGDVHVGTGAVQWIREVAPRFRNVIYIMGNHEYYHNTFPDLIQDVKAALEKDHNVLVLENQAVTIDSVRFAAGTLWTDFNHGDIHSKLVAQRGMTDYYEIRIPSRDGESSDDGTRKLLADDIYEYHNRAIAWLLGELEEAHDGPRVVVTHHLPSYDSVHRRYRVSTREPLNPAYYSDLDYILDGYDISLWIHGHTHMNADYERSGTRVVCNPFGYYKYEENPEFDPDLVIEV